MDKNDMGDMKEEPDAIKQNIISAYNTDALLTWIDKNIKAASDNSSPIQIQILEELHNSKQIDLTQTIKSIKNETQIEYDFWRVQNFFCSLIPRLEFSVTSLVSAIAYLTNQGGSDMAASRPNAALRDWLKLRPDETDSLLKKALQPGESTIELFTFVLEAGFHSHPSRYLSVSLDFLSNSNFEYRLSALTALSRIELREIENATKKVAQALSDFIKGKRTTTEISSATTAILSVHSSSPTTAPKLVLDTIMEASQEPSPEFHYALAASLNFHHSSFSKELNTSIINILSSVDPSLLGTIQNIDSAFTAYIKDSNKREIANCIQTMCDHDEHPLEIKSLGSLVHSLNTKNRSLLLWLIIFWLREGSKNMRLQISFLLDHGSGNDILEFPIGDFNFRDQELIFVCRKAIGYLWIHPSVAVSIAISCISWCSNRETRESISNLLFDPLMISYSGQAREVVEAHAKSKPKLKRILRKALSNHDDYIDHLTSMPTIWELQPSASERKAQYDYQHKKMSSMHKKAQSESLLLSFFKSKTILQGRGSINYTVSAPGDMKREVALLKTYKTSIELPRIDTIDPTYFQHMIIVMREEELEL